MDNRRHTPSREEYWRGLFNSYTRHTEDHLISGWSYEGWRQRFCAYFKEFGKIGLPKDAMILDLGCGAGTYMRALANEGYDVIGLDYALGVVQEAHKRSSSTQENFLCGSIYDLPFRSLSLDHILCIGVFQSVMRQREALIEVKRILACGGTLVVMTLNTLEMTTMLKKLLRTEEKIYINDKSFSRLQTYNPYSFKRCLKKMGFSGVKVFPVQILPKGLKWAEPFARAWSQVPFFSYLTARSFMVLAKKSDGED